MNFKSVVDKIVFGNDCGDKKLADKLFNEYFDENNNVKGDETTIDLIEIIEGYKVYCKLWLVNLYRTQDNSNVTNIINVSKSNLGEVKTLELIESFNDEKYLGYIIKKVGDEFLVSFEMNADVSLRYMLNNSSQVYHFNHYLSQYFGKAIFDTHIKAMETVAHRVLQDHDEVEKYTSQFEDVYLQNYIMIIANQDVFKEFFLDDIKYSYNDIVNEQIEYFSNDLDYDDREMFDKKDMATRHKIRNAISKLNEVESRLAFNKTDERKLANDINFYYRVMETVVELSLENKK